MSGRRRGRPQEVSVEHVRSVALDLFAAQGYDATSLTQIARDAGISRTTLFALFPTKRDIVWADHDLRMERLRAVLANSGVASVRDIIERGLLTIAHYSVDERDVLKRRYRLTASSPELRAYSSLAVAEVADEILGAVRGRHPESDAVVVDRVVRALMAVSASIVDEWANEVSPVDDLEPYLESRMAPFVQALTPLLGAESDSMHILRE